MGLPQLRWWDNYAWTEFTSAARTPLVMQDEPKLAYADDDLPSRRSQREQRQQDGNRQQTGNRADLASTLRQLEPPKPQNIELNQPAPDFADTHASSESSPEQQGFGQQGFEQQGFEQQRFEQQRHEQQLRDQQRQEQLLREQQQEQAYRDQQYRAPEPEADPFAEFLAEPGLGEPAAPRDTTQGTRGGYADQAPFGGPGAFTETGFDQTTAGAYSQPQPAAQFGQRSGQFGADQGAAGQYDYAQARMGIHSPLAYTPFVWIIA